MLGTLATASLSETVTFEHLSKVEHFDLRFLGIDAEDGQKFIDIDCQSFLHKLDFYQDGQLTFENYISERECAEILETFGACIEEEGFMCVDSKDIHKFYCECETDTN